MGDLDISTTSKQKSPLFFNLNKCSNLSFYFPLVNLLNIVILKISVSCGISRGKENRLSVYRGQGVPTYIFGLCSQSGYPHCSDVLQVLQILLKGYTGSSRCVLSIKCFKNQFLLHKSLIVTYDTNT